MLEFYFIVTFVIIMGMLMIRSREVVRGMILLVLLLQFGIFFYGYRNEEITVLRYFTFDSLAVLFLGILALISTATVIHGFTNLKDNTTRRYQQYHAALAGLIFSVTGAMLSNHITVTWIFVEATTLTASVLIYYEKNKLTLEAAWKYVFVCSTGIAIAYMGILFLGFSLQGSSGFDLSYRLMAGKLVEANPLYLKIAFLFVLVGYTTKMELFPMHTAGIDANSVAQPQIGAFISTVMVNMGYIAFFRVYKMLAPTPIFYWMNHVLLITGILSLLTATGYMLKARHTKRMFAYSTMEVMGLVAIALSTGGLGTYAALLLLVVHSFTKSSLFYQLSQLYRTMHTYMIKEVGQYMTFQTSGGMVLLFGTIGILAIPPSGLFIPEIQIFGALISVGYWPVMVIVASLLCFIVYAFSMRMMHILFSEPIEIHIDPLNPETNYLETFIQFTFLLMSMSICFYRPEWLQSLISRAGTIFII